MYFPSTLALPISDSYPSSRSGALSLILYLKEDFKEHKAKALLPNYQYMDLFLFQLLAARGDLRPGVNLWICFVYVNLFFWRARVCRPPLCLCRPFMIFEGCLDSNPECCRSKLARYRLSHPSLYVNLPPLIKGKYEDDVSRTLL